MSYTLFYLPAKVRVLKDNDWWDVGRIFETRNKNNMPEWEYHYFKGAIYFALLSGVLEPVDEEAEKIEEILSSLVNKYQKRIPLNVMDELVDDTRKVLKEWYKK